MFYYANRAICSAGLVLLVVGGCAFAEPVGSAQTAASIAAQVTGFLAVDDSNKVAAGDYSVTIETLHDSTTPFVGDSLDGRRVWTVTWGPIKLDLPNTVPEYAAGRPFDASVKIDSITGRLLEATFSQRTNLDSLLPLLSADSAKVMMEENEQFTGLPIGPPTRSLREVLSGIKRPTAGARQLVVHHLLYTNWKVKDRPVWVVEMRGLPPYQCSNHVLRHWRYIIDAHSGAVIVSDNGPPRNLPSER